MLHPRHAICLSTVLLLCLSSCACAVRVDDPSGPVQLKAGCTGGTADFCGLRMYEIMVESFVDGDAAHNYNAGYGTSHHRGDIRGIINSLDYIKNTGMNAIWLTPVFDSKAGTPQDRLTGFDPVNLQLDATGYYTRDYFNIDPRFGTLEDARELVDTAHAKGMYVLFDGVFGHHKGALVPSPTGQLPVDSTDWADYGGSPQNYPGRIVDYGASASIDFYKEVATYWIDELGIDGWRLDQAFQVPPAAWREIKAAVQTTSAQRAAAGEQWGTLGYAVAEVWSGATQISNTVYGSNLNPILDSAFDFPVRYATVGVVAAEESGWSGRPAFELANSWSYGAHDQTYPDHALPNLMLGNHDLVRLGDLIQRADLAEPTDADYWTRHRLMFMVQAAYSGPITRYYGEEIGDEVPGYADQVTNNCANLGLCDDHVARTSAKILDVTVSAGQLSADQHALLDFHRDLMDIRSQYSSLSHGSRQHLYSDDVLYVDLKTLGDEQIVFAMNVSDEPMLVELDANLFAAAPPAAWDLLNEVAVNFNAGYLSFVLQPLSGHYILLDEIERSSAGDFNLDGDVDVLDLDALLAEGPIASGVAVGGANGQFDLTGDDVIDLGDRDAWLALAAAESGLGAPYFLGDANLDGIVDEQDFSIWNAARFSATLLWSGGNFNGDGVTDGRDLLEWNENKFSSSHSAVPEPTAALALLAWGLFSCGRRSAGCGIF